MDTSKKNNICYYGKIENSDVHITDINLFNELVLTQYNSEKEFELMKDTSYLINVARGELVDTKALFDAITNNKISGCALDVIECESSGVFCEKKTNNKEATECVSECNDTNLIIKKLVEANALGHHSVCSGGLY